MNDPHDDLSEHPDLAATSAAMRADLARGAGRGDARRGRGLAAPADTGRPAARAHAPRRRHDRHGRSVAASSASSRRSATDVLALRTASGRDRRAPRRRRIAFEYDGHDARARRRSPRLRRGRVDRFRAALLVREQDAQRAARDRSPNRTGVNGALPVGADHVVLSDAGYRVRRAAGERRLGEPAPD